MVLKRDEICIETCSKGQCAVLEAIPKCQPRHVASLVFPFPVPTCNNDSMENCRAPRNCYSTHKLLQRSGKSISWTRATAINAFLMAKKENGKALHISRNATRNFHNCARALSSSSLPLLALCHVPFPTFPFALAQLFSPVKLDGRAVRKGMPRLVNLELKYTQREAEIRVDFYQNCENLL